MRGLLRRVLEVIRPHKLDRESMEELETHVEMLVTRKREAGVAEAEARRQARLELGSVASVRQQLAEERTGFPLEQLRRELWQAARALGATPGLTAISVATIGVGLGISTLLFALVNGIVLTPLRYPEPNRLVRIFDTNREANVERSGVASGNVADWRRGTTAFDGIAGYYAMGRTVTTDAQSEVVIT